VTGVLRTIGRLVGTAAVAAVTAACATHATPRVATPQPFPLVMSPASLRPAPPRMPAHPVSSGAVLATALTFQGVPYQYGGTTPASGFDCSGFVQYVLGKHEIALPRTAAEQFRLGQRITERNVQAGDLVFFSTIAPGASHVGLALNADEFVHAPATSGAVRVERLRSTYWQQRFVGARRLFSE